MKLNLWPIDADDITYNDQTIIYRTEEIRNFLSKENDVLSFISATKGIGKTFLLNMKRLKMEKSLTFLPESGIDKFSGIRVQGHESIRFFADHENMAKLWSVSIILAVLKKVGFLFDKNEISPFLEKLYGDKNVKTVTNFFLRLIGIDQNEFHKALADYNSSLKSHYEYDVSTGITIFIDNIDEAFRKHLENDLSKKDADSPDVPVSDLWYSSQMGLAQGFFELHKLNHHVRLFATIRKEAIFKYQGKTELLQQISGRILNLDYASKELEQIFIAYIKGENEKKFKDYSLMEKNPVKAFFGFDKISRKEPRKQEKLVDYIIRHTLSRPRDLMQIGNKLSKIDKDERTGQKIKDIVHAESISIVKNYIAEVKPHTEIRFGDKFKDALKHIENNAMTREELLAICSLVNEMRTEACKKLSCENCDKDHIFCTLYKIGLLGTIYNDGKEGEGQQKFCLPGEESFRTGHILPESKYYLIHPILNQMIMERNQEFMNKRNKENIIGNGLPWKYPGSGKTVSKESKRDDPPVGKTVARLTASLKADICNYSDFMQSDLARDQIKFINYLKTNFNEDNLDCQYVDVFKGDSIIVADKSAAKVCEAGFAMVDKMLEKKQAIRVALDYGKVIWDEVKGVVVTGGPLLNCERIEPYVSPNQLYCTGEFMDRLVKETPKYKFIDLFQDTPEQDDEPGKEHKLKDIKVDGKFRINKPKNKKEIFVKLYRIKRT
jgi:hypothetical protein